VILKKEQKKILHQSFFMNKITVSILLAAGCRQPANYFSPAAKGNCNGL
jgi:hypothetical protein